MIKSKETPYPNICAFEFIDDITLDQFEKVVIPEVEAKVDIHDELNLLYVISTELKNFSLGAWLKDAMIGLDHLAKFNRTAIITDNKLLQSFTEAFSKVMPGEFRGFDKAEYELAEKWVGMGN